MKLSLLLHFHQPPSQFAEITQSVINNCYLPLFKFLSLQKKARFTLNFTCSILEMLKPLPDGRHVLELVRELASGGKVELTGTGAYHPLLSRLPDGEIARQIEVNEECLRGFFGVKLNGFFPPELAVSEKVIWTVDQKGYGWVLVDESAFAFKKDPGFYRHKSGIRVVVRDDTISGAVAFGEVKTSNDLFDLLQASRREHAVLAMDGETFGHHLRGRLKVLKSIVNDGRMELVTVSEAVKYVKDGKSGRVKESTWGSTEADFKKKRIYTRWNIPGNEVHKKQWELFRLAIKVVNSCSPLERESGCWELGRELLDKAEHSDQFWWASANPCWHPDMVQRGAEMLKGAIFATSGVAEKDKRRAEKLFNELVRLGREKFGEKAVMGQITNF